MPRVIDAQYLHDYFIHIVFSNVKEGTIDLKPFIGQGVFEPLTNQAYIKNYLLTAATFPGQKVQILLLKLFMNLLKKQGIWLMRNNHSFTHCVSCKNTGQVVRVIR
jgi:hypothetical protein